MSTEVAISLTVNGERISRRVEARRHLIDFLRLDLGLMGSHAGCEHGVCGACTVRVNGLIVRGCLVLAASLDGDTVETIEGVSDTGEIRDLQDAFVARNACQCGYCTPGMLLTAAELLRDAAEHPRGALPRRHPRASVGQLLSLHRLSRHRRRGRDGGQGQGSGLRSRQAMSPVIDPRSVDRPNSYIGRSIPRPNARKLVEGRGQYVDDLVLPRMVHVAFVRSPHAHAKIGRIDASAALKTPRRAARLHRPGPGSALRALGGRSRPPQGHEVGRAAASAARDGDLGWRGGSRRRGRQPRRRRGRRGQGLDRLAGARAGRRHGDGPRQGNAGHPSRSRRQPRLRARQRERQRRRGLQERAQGRRGDVPLRSPHRRDAGAALDPRRVQQGRRHAHRPPCDAGPAHDAGGVGPAPQAAAQRRARHLPRYRRQLRHQGARLPGRGGGGGDRQDHGPTGQVHRRSPGELRLRHPRARSPHQGPHGHRRAGAHHRLRHRRSDRHRPLLGLSPHQRGGRQSGRQPGGRPLRLPQLPRQDHGRAAEQGADLPVSRGRPPDRDGRHRGPGRPRRRGDGHGPGRLPPQEPDAGRHLSAHVARRHALRGPLAHQVHWRCSWR